MITVYCRTRFVAVHRWAAAPDTPEVVQILQNPHRHEFHVKASVFVTHRDRDVEFQTLRRDVDTYVRAMFVGAPCLPYSCEQIATMIATWLRNERHYTIADVDVSEDGENGARVFYDHPSGSVINGKH